MILDPVIKVSYISSSTLPDNVNSMSAPWKIIVIISLLSLSAYNFTYVLKRNSLGFLSQPNFFGSAQESDNFGGEAEINELDGCYHVFIDVGSNIGNQVRK